MVRTGYGLGVKRVARIAVHAKHKPIPATAKRGAVRRLLKRHNYHKHVKLTLFEGTRAVFINNRRIVSEKVKL